MEPERIIFGGRDEFCCAQDDLDQGIYQRSDGLAGGAVTHQSSPELQAVYELPVVDGQHGVLLVGGDGVPQVYGQLSDVNKGLIVGKIVVQPEHLHQ